MYRHSPAYADLIDRLADAVDDDLPRGDEPRAMPEPGIEIITNRTSAYLRAHREIKREGDEELAHLTELARSVAWTP